MVITSTSNKGMVTWFSPPRQSSCQEADRMGRVHHSRKRIGPWLKSHSIISLPPRSRLAMLTPLCRAILSPITGSSSTTLIRITTPFCPMCPSNLIDLSKRGRGQGIIVRKARSPTPTVSIMVLERMAILAPLGTSSGTLLSITLVLSSWRKIPISWKGPRRRCLFLISLRRSKNSWKLSFSRFLLVMARLMYQSKSANKPSVQPSILKDPKSLRKETLQTKLTPLEDLNRILISSNTWIA